MQCLINVKEELHNDWGFGHQWNKTKTRSRSWGEINLLEIRFLRHLNLSLGNWVAELISVGFLLVIQEWNDNAAYLSLFCIQLSLALKWPMTKIMSSLSEKKFYFLHHIILTNFMSILQCPSHGKLWRVVKNSRLKSRHWKEIEGSLKYIPIPFLQKT